MKILCAERDRTKRRQLKRDLREVVPGADITVCRDPRKAEAAAKAKGCDVLVTDTVFDGFALDGIMVAEQIRRVNPRANIIFVTDYADSSAALEAWRLRACAFLQRPYDKQQLAEAFTNPRFIPAQPDE